MDHHADKQSGNLERFREYLSLLARLQLDARLQAKVDLSGVIQQTLLEAYRAGDRVQGQDDEDLARWLRQILANNLVDEVRKFRTQARDVGRERSLEVDLADGMRPTLEPAGLPVNPAKRVGNHHPSRVTDGSQH